VYAAANCTIDTSLIATGSPVVTDNCSGTTLSYSDDVTGLTECNGTGTILRTFTATDSCGNISTCVQAITVLDTTKPEITCPANDTVYKSTTCTIDTSLTATGSPIVTDNCTGFSLSYSDDVTGLTECNGTGTILRTFTATDSCGNISTCVQAITVLDTTKPAITCPANDTVYTAANCTIDTSLSATGSASIIDNCPGGTVTYLDDVSGLTGCNGTGILLRTFTATDSCGNINTCTQFITILDTTKPSIVCPANDTVYAAANCAIDTSLSATGSPMIIGSCSGAELTYSDDVSGLTECNGTGIIQRTFTATDSCGNISTCVQAITVLDTTKPEITCPANDTVYAAANCAIDTSLIATGSPVVTDNCSGTTLSYSDDVSGLTECNGTGTILRTFTATDSCGNIITCVQQITVLDTTKPSITCPANDTVYKSTTCTIDTSLIATGSPIVTDNCTGFSLSYSDDVTGLTECNGTGTILRTFTATDSCGNISTCVQAITVLDTTKPEITCPANDTVYTAANCTIDTSLSATGSASIIDNCPGGTVTYSDDVSGLTGCNGTGIVLRTFTATDSCGNINTCTQFITILDTTKPSIVCPANDTVYTAANCTIDTSLSATGSPMIIGSCSGAELTYSDDVSGLTECNGTGIIQRTFTVTDSCGNINTCTQQITVLDTTKPEITCPANDTVYASANCAIDTSLIATGSPVVTDNCTALA
jgi:uncharacterized Fe-S cluster protein YjdI